MEKDGWTSSELRKFFHYSDRHKSIQTLYNAEERGDIPKAERISRGKVSIRVWPENQVPLIGKKIGFLQPPKKQRVISKYIQKGGVLKTTTTFNEARTFALNGIKTLIVGLDFECSVTDVILPRVEISSLEDTKEPLGLWHVLSEDASLDKVIKKTSLPTLDIIPETHDLVVLEKWLRHQTRKEYVFRDRLLPLLSDYDVIIFDNGPSWNALIENSLTASQVVICPLACGLLAYNAAETNLDSIFQFRDEMQLEWDSVIMFATLLERTALSQQIYGQYLSKFKDYIISTPIRSSVKGQEALVYKKTFVEYAPNSNLAQEYYDLIRELWQRTNSYRKENEDSSQYIKENIEA